MRLRDDREYMVSGSNLIVLKNWTQIVGNRQLTPDEAQDLQNMINLVCDTAQMLDEGIT